MNFSAWAIDKPIPPILLFMLLCLAGIVGFQKLPVQHLPDLDFPTVAVTATLPGASPATLETEVTRRIEDSLASLGAVRHITSVISDGLSSTTVMFELEKNPQEAVSDIRNAVEVIRNKLPAEMQNPTISRVTTTGDAILTFAVKSSVLDEADLSWFVDNDITKRLLAVTGVGELMRIGGIEREILISLDQVALEALNVTAADVSSQLRSLLKEYPAGETRLGDMEQSIRTLSTASNREDIAGLTISLASGQAVRLDAFARIEDTAAERREISLVDGEPVITFSVKRSRGASEVDTAIGARAAVAELNQRFPHIEITEVNNSITPVTNNYKAAMDTLYEGIVLAIIAVFIFLRDWRATLVAAVALPLSIIPTFAIISLLDFQLNSITLLALTLIIGVLVDDAIVEIENIERHLLLGAPPRVAALAAANEIGLAVIATSLTLVAVFLPTAFMSGMAGMFFKQFGWTASIAVLLSLMVARLLTPMMAASIMRAKPQLHNVKTPGKIFSTYLFLVNKSIKHPLVTVFLAIAFLVISALILLQLPTNFVDAEDTDQILVTLDAAPGSSIAETTRLAEEAREVIAAHAEVVNIYTTIGAGGADVRKAKLLVSLTPIVKHDRRSQQDIEQSFREELQQIAGARISIGGNAAGQQLAIVLKSDNALSLQHSAQQVISELRTLPGLGAISSSASLLRPEVNIIPDYDRAAELGVTASSISEAIRVATSSDYEQNLPRLNLPNRQVYVKTQLSLEARADLDTIRNIKVFGNNGAVPLSSVAEISLQGGPAQIDRLDRSRNVTITIDTLNRPLGDINKQLDKLGALQNLPSDVVRVSAGDAEQQEALFAGFALAMIAGVLCVYAVLVLLFHDFLQPVTILVALPLSAGGAFAGLALLGYSLSLSSLIGLIMLMGIVSKNSILLVEFAIMSRAEYGLSRSEAIIDACRKRARPIIMTSFAMIAGMLPMALQLGAPSAFRGGMAIAVIGGLITSTALSLLVVPAVYVLIDDLKQTLGKWVARVDVIHEQQGAAKTR